MTPKKLKERLSAVNMLPDNLDTYEENVACEPLPPLTVWGKIKDVLSIIGQTAALLTIPAIVILIVVYPKGEKVYSWSCYDNTGTLIYESPWNKKYRDIAIGDNHFRTYDRQVLKGICEHNVKKL